MHQASTCGPVPQSPGPTPSAQKLWYLDVMLRIMNPVSQMATDEIQEEKYYRESINIKTRVSVTVSALTGSVQLTLTTKPCHDEFVLIHQEKNCI